MVRLAFILLMLTIVAGDAQQHRIRRVVRQTAAAGGGYTANATTFAGDGQCWMERDAGLTGAADGKSCTLSFWVDFSSGDNTVQRLLYSQTGRVRGAREGSDNKIRFLFVNPAGTALADFQATTTQVAAGGWYHVIISFDKSVETRRHLYVNGVESLTVLEFLSDDVDGNTDNVDFKENDWSLGALVDDGTAPLVGCFSEFYLSMTYVDLSVEANRDIFYHADGPPQDLSAVNSPIIYLKDPFGTFTVNSGSGGNFVKKGTTAFTECAAP